MISGATAHGRRQGSFRLPLHAVYFDRAAGYLRRNDRARFRKLQQRRCHRRPPGEPAGRIRFGRGTCNAGRPATGAPAARSRGHRHPSTSGTDGPSRRIPRLAARHPPACSPRTRRARAAVRALSAATMRRESRPLTPPPSSPGLGSNAERRTILAGPVVERPPRRRPAGEQVAWFSSTTGAPHGRWTDIETVS